MESLTKIENDFTYLSSYKSKKFFSSIVNEPKKAECSYSIVPVTNNDVQTVTAFLRKYFFRDEPLNEAIQLLEETGSVLELEKYCISCLQYGMSFMAVSHTGDIMGVILNSILKRDEVEEDNDDDEAYIKTLRFNDIVVLLDKIKREADVFAQYPNVDRVLEIKIVTVNETYRGQGVCKALIDKTKEFASEIGCKLLYVECTSHFSAKAVERLGFKCIYSLQYTDHLNAEGEIVFKTPYPHNNANIYVLPLND